MVGNSAVGVYSTLYTVSSLSLMVWTAINASFYTVFVPRHGKPEKQNQKNFLWRCWECTLWSQFYLCTLPRKLWGFWRQQNTIKEFILCPHCRRCIFYCSVKFVFGYSGPFKENENDHDFFCDCSTVECCVELSHDQCIWFTWLPHIQHWFPIS